MFVSPGAYNIRSMFGDCSVEVVIFLCLGHSFGLKTYIIEDMAQKRWLSTDHTYKYYNPKVRSQMR